MHFMSGPIHLLKLSRVLSVNVSGKPFPVASTWVRQTHAVRTLSNLKPLNSTITRCMRNGLVEEAQNLFGEMAQRNTVTWNAMIRGYFQNGQFEKGFVLYDQMPERDIYSYNTMIAGLMQCGNVNGAKQVFEEMPIRDVVTWNSMISGYIHNNLLDEAVRVFYAMPLKNLISWNLVIAGLVNFKEIILAEELFNKMSSRDVASWTIMISGLASAGRIVEARALFDDMPGRDIQAWNSIIAGYIANGNIEIAEALFQKMPEHDFDSWKEMINGFVICGRIKDSLRLFLEMPHKHQRSWNSIIMGMVSNGLFKEVHALLEKMPFHDVVSWTNIIIGYFEIGDVESAVKLFELMPIRDAIVWNTTIFGLGKNDRGEEGLKCFIRMKDVGVGPSPDEATYTSVLTICSDLLTLHLGKQVHGQVIKTGFDCFIAVSNAVVTMYGRCGNMDSALLEFCSKPTHDVISWNSIICVFAQHGNGEKTIEMFEYMISSDVKPNQITFVGVLSVCSHAGLVEQGKYYFNFMKHECLLQPTAEHYTCMVDLLGRSGHISEAMAFLTQMREDGVEVPASVWGAMLQACRMHKNVEMGEIAGEKILEMEPYNTGVYMILAEMYLSSGRRDLAEEIWVRMKERGMKKQPGCSWIEVNNRGHVFLAGDSFHPEFSRIYCILDMLHMEMEIGVLKSSSVFQFQEFEI
ncbi:pentatricopeptide repeat-containing protein At4g02750-like [Malania oleifera]|uniref:pentatricopeptide repeat-containing protein At4g02750-like n=1 Tax=Malania oleifera TaxID=397392 RepID=UPI0025AE0D3D|nr:pentatricopeptide repeat-containing protein At4g02750-like [Malania oleifera]